MAKNDKRTNNDLQNKSQKTKDRATRTLLKTRDELRCSGRVSISCSTSVTRRVILVTNPVISHEWWKNWEILTTSISSMNRCYPFTLLFYRVSNLQIIKHFQLDSFVIILFFSIRRCHIDLLVGNVISLIW